MQQIMQRKVFKESDWPILLIGRKIFENTFRRIAKRNVKIRTIGRLKMNVNDEF